ncbi:EAL domain-containing protein [Halorhodospira halochloris]|uniref:EAL domain-containing protein n=1 Tax=Halorhodospira halochloris TaxID=1052 RepID=UPI001EE95BA9|nr:EAL domain-containing protein [Halorhodospira halochloris]MCG5529696.1 EAL domain-containing protein [Halorhodospira halochloris]
MSSDAERFIRDHAYRNALSLTEVAQRAGMSRQSLYAIWNSGATPSISKATELAQALNVHPMQLIEHFLGSMNSPHTIEDAVINLNWSSDLAQLTKSLLRNSAEPTIGINRQGKVLIYNYAAQELLARPAAEVQNTTIDKLLPTPATQRIFEQLNTTGPHQRERHRESFRFRMTYYGDERTLTASLIEAPLDSTELFLIIFYSVDAGQATPNNLISAPPQAKPTYDPETGLPEEQHLPQLINYSISLTNWIGGHMGLLLIDLENINLSEQHNSSVLHKRLMAHVTNRVRNGLRNSDHIAMASKSTLAVILNGVTNTHRIEDIAWRIRSSLLTPGDDDLQKTEIAPRIGAAIYPEHAQDPDELLHIARRSLQEGRRRRTSLCIADDDLITGVKQQLLMLSELEQALANEQLDISYEPIHELNSGRLVGFEARPLWQHPLYGTIATSQLLETAGTAGLLSELAKLTLQRALSEIGELYQRPLTKLRITLDVSAQVLCEESSLTEFLRSATDNVANPHWKVELEIPEGELSEVDSSATEEMKKMREHGIGMAIDYFGEGHTPLFSLAQMPADRLKVQMPGDPQNPIELKKHDTMPIIARLGAQARYQLTAFGVRSADQAQHLRDIGFDEAQGPYFSDPLGATQLEEYLIARLEHQS